MNLIKSAWEIVKNNRRPYNDDQISTIGPAGGKHAKGRVL